jgi:hypothetical protein
MNNVLVQIGKSKNWIYVSLFFLLIGCGNIMSEEESKAWKDRESKVKLVVSDWIQNHALYPQSYKSESFSEYSEAVTSNKEGVVPNSEVYVIKHTHQILDKDSNMANFSGYFIIEHDYTVCVIEENRSNSIGGGSVIDVQVWTNKFGRAANKQDSIDMENRQRASENEFIDNMKSGLESGNMHSGDPNGLATLKNLIDSLDKKRKK